MKRALLAASILFGAVLGLYAQQPMRATGAPVAAHSAPMPPASPEKIWAELMEGNERFVAGKPARHDVVGLRGTLAKGQHPQVIVLGCSDSRVAPELLFDQTLGDLFVVRSAGNLADAVGLGSIEYAVEHLGSTVVVVLGHQKCGAVTAACSQQKMPTPNLQAIVDKINPAVLAVGDSEKGDARIEAAIRQNVHHGARELLVNSEILRHAADEGRLTVIEAEYSLDTGRVTRLEPPTVH